ncbi:MAG: phenylalanine--tRNA ligase subunit alpha [Pseudomonadota bacterium]
MDLSKEISKIETQAIKKLQKADNFKELENIEIAFLGRKGKLTLLLRDLANVSKEDRPKIGKFANEVKNKILSEVEDIRSGLKDKAFSNLESSEWLDITSPGKKIRQLGSIHPITQIRYEIEEIFSSMGFHVLDGPEVETEFNNFIALNIPDDHPARDTQDTFWLDDDNLLRTQTSNIQVRGMKKLKPPFSAIAPGRCFRNEAIDASHEHTFYQIEGLMIDKNITVANLIYVLKTLVSEIMKEDVEVRLRPGYFPFVEPGFELDMKCRICNGQGCSVCKKVGWIEVLPCGMVHPNVLKFGGLDPNEWTGFAFGLGLDRLVMMRYNIHDIRYFQSGNLRFLKQF